MRCQIGVKQMRELTRFEDERRGIRRFELSDGKWIDLSAQDIEEYGLKALLAHHGYSNELDARLDLIEDGRKIGTLPGSFDPMNVKSGSFCYKPRRGDFEMRGNQVHMIAHLGAGDLESIPGFRWHREESHNATPQQHETATSAENHNETDS